VTTYYSGPLSFGKMLSIQVGGRAHAYQRAHGEAVYSGPLSLGR
jgi:hypothetical protein